MSIITVDHEVGASAAKVWKTLEDFGGVAKWNPVIATSRILPGKPATGVGAERQCDMDDGKNWLRERVVSWDPGRSMTIDIYEGTMPLASAQGTLSVEALGPERSRVVMTMEYRPKMGVLGAMMDAIVLKRMMRGMMSRGLKGLSDVVVPSESRAAAPA